MLPVSKDTLLRVVRRGACAHTQAAPRIIGIDGWARRRGPRYGTLVYDLDRRPIVDLLPDCEMATVADWITARPALTSSPATALAAGGAAGYEACHRAGPRLRRGCREAGEPWPEHDAGAGAGFGCDACDH